MRYKRESPYIFTNYIYITTKPGYLNNVIGPVLSYTAVVFNVFIIAILSAKTMRSPSSVLMQGLALSDTLTAFFSYGLEPFLVRYYLISEDTRTTVIHYPYCKLHNYKPIIADMFHLVSVMLTSSLGIQKAVAIKWPVWSYTVLSRKMMYLAVVVVLALSISIHIPRMLVADFRLGSRGNRCEIAGSSVLLVKYTYNYFPVISAVLILVSSLIMILTTIIIVWSLLSKRNIQVNESETLQNIRKRSSKLIAVLTITFLVIEFPRIFIFGIIQLSSANEVYSAQLLVEYNTQLLVSAVDLFKIPVDDIEVLANLKLMTEIVRLLIVVACLSNFIIYIAMSKNIRDVIKRKFTCCKRPNTHTRTTDISMT